MRRAHLLHTTAASRTCSLATRGQASCPAFAHRQLPHLVSQRAGSSSHSGLSRLAVAWATESAKFTTNSGRQPSCTSPIINWAQASSIFKSVATCFTRSSWLLGFDSFRSIPSTNFSQVGVIVSWLLDSAFCFKPELRNKDLTPQRPSHCTTDKGSPCLKAASLAPDLRRVQPLICCKSCSGTASPSDPVHFVAAIASHLRAPSMSSLDTTSTDAPTCPTTGSLRISSSDQPRLFSFVILLVRTLTTAWKGQSTGPTPEGDRWQVQERALLPPQPEGLDLLI